MSLVSRKRAILLAKATIPLTLAALPSLVRAQSLSVVTFNNSFFPGGGGYTLNGSVNNSSDSTLTTSELVDVNKTINVESSTTGIALAVHSTSGSLTPVTVGAIAFDEPVAPAGGTQINFDALSSATTSTMGGTLSLGGGSLDIGSTLPSGATTAAQDLITVTSNVGGLVDLGPKNGLLYIATPSTGGNFDVALNNALTIDVNASLLGSGSININGAGTVSVLANQSAGFSGGFQISNGTLSVANSTYALGASGATTTFNGGVLLINYNNALFGISRPFYLASPSAGGIAIPAGNSNTFGGRLDGPGALIKLGGGTLILESYENVASYTPTYSGGVAIDSGTLNFLSGNDLGAPDNTVTLNGGTLAYTGFVQTSTTTTFVSTTVASSHSIVLAAAVDDIDVGELSSSSISLLTINSPISGPGTLLKSSVGSLVLGAGNTYTGGTKIYNGTLLANNTTGFATGAGSVTVGDGTSANVGTLGGSGFIAGDIIVNQNGVLAPGLFGGSRSSSYTPATLTGGGSLTLPTGSTFVDAVANSGSFSSVSLTSAAGSLNFDGSKTSVKLALVSVAGTTGPLFTDKYEFITLAAGETVNGFTTTTYSGGTLASAGTFYIDTTGATGFDVSNAIIGEDAPTAGTPGDIYFTDVQAPEPGIGAIVIGWTLPLMRRRRTKAV